VKLSWIAIIAALLAGPAAAQTTFPDVRGTWKGESESVVLGGGNSHHGAAMPNSDPQLRTLPFTLTIDKQDGRRFAGKFSSGHANEIVIGVISRNGTIYMVDDDGYVMGTILAPNRMELCYLHLSTNSRVASCTEMIKQ
jgi:hypothetical protein